MQLGRSVDESGKEQPVGNPKLPAPPGQTTMADVYARMKHQHQKEYITYKREKRKATSKQDVPNSSWFFVASLLQQGGEDYPIALSSRIPTVLWWMAIMVFVATYTANMAAFLTADRLTTTISSIEDLGGQKEVFYGVTNKTASSAYFQNSQIPLYQNMYKFLKDNGGLIPTTEEALAKVRSSTNPDFAYISGSAALQYEAMQPPCDVRVVGPIFAQIGYGLALARDSPYPAELSKAIMKLRQTGFMDNLYKKWFTDQGECQDSPQDNADDPTDYRIGILDLLGVFYIISGGVVLSFLLLVVEWLVFSYLESKKYGGKRNLESFNKAFSDKVRHLKEDIKRDWFPRLPYCIRPQWQQTTQVAAHDPHVQVHALSAAAERMAREWRHGVKAQRNTDIISRASTGKIRKLTTSKNLHGGFDSLSGIDARKRYSINPWNSN